MSRRVNLERNLYESTRADGRRVFEIGYRDSFGKQRWKALPTGTTKTDARAERDVLVGARGAGKVVKPSPKLKFAEAAERWRADKLPRLRPTTQAAYRNDLDRHLLPRWGRKRLDAITVTDAARLVVELREEGKAEWTAAGILKVANLVLKYARRHLGWVGQNPIADLDSDERPQPSSTPRRRLYTPAELAATLAAAGQPWRALFALAADTGARESELLGLTWEDLELADPEDPHLRIRRQVDRTGEPVPLKTKAAEREVELQPGMRRALLEHRARTKAPTRPDSFVFATRTGRPLGQRNVLRSLRLAQTKARDEQGRPTFPALFEDEPDAEGCWLPRRDVPRNVVPHFHGLRHTYATEAIAAGESLEEVAWALGHADSSVTAQVYVQKDRSKERRQERRARRRARIDGRHVEAGSALEAHNLSTPIQAPAELLDFPLGQAETATGGSRRQ